MQMYFMEISGGFGPTQEAIGKNVGGILGPNSYKATLFCFLSLRIFLIIANNLLR